MMERSKTTPDAVWLQAQIRTTPVKLGGMDYEVYRIVAKELLPEGSPRIICCPVAGSR
jgi:hypothetical protein